MKVCSWKEKLFRSLSEPKWAAKKFLTTPENEGGVSVSVACVACGFILIYFPFLCALCFCFIEILAISRLIVRVSLAAPGSSQGRHN